MSNKHTAQHDGHTFKRTSQGRIYSHAIISKVNIASRRVKVEADSRYTYRMNLEYYQQRAKGADQFGRSLSADDVAKAQAYVNDGEDAYVAQALAAYDAKKFDRMASDGLHYYTDAAWASRLDLAVKQAGPGDIILPAQVKQ